MKIFKSDYYSTYINLPLEELIAKDPDMKGDILFLYQHSNTVIIGKNQNTYEEIKYDYIKENNIELARRMSGGGAVYQDLGNICFSFITDYNKQGGYERFLTPIIAFLNSLGLKAEFKGRNDLICNGAKISGNSQYIKGNRIVSHGTLLFNVDLTKLSNALNPSKIKIESKGIKSIRQRVTNIYDELNPKMEVNEFIDKLIQYFVDHFDAQYEELPLEKYKDELNKISEYRKSDEWIFGRNPKFDAENVAKFPGGILKVKFNVENSKIKDIKFEGDFLALKPLEEIMDKFINIEYTPKAIEEVLDSINLNEYFGTLTKEEIISLIFGQ